MRRTTTGPVIAVKVIVDNGDEDVWKADDDDDDDVAPMNTKKKRHLIDASVEIDSMAYGFDG